MEKIYRQLTNIVLTQGIVGPRAISPHADFQQDFKYSQMDIAELIVLTERALNISIPDEDHNHFCTLYESAMYLSRKLQSR